MPVDLFFVYPGELLHQASIYDQSEFLAQLLSNNGNGDANSKDQIGRTPLHTAAQHGSNSCLKVLLNTGGNPNLVSSTEDHCSTPAHHAAYNGHLACLQLLVGKGADLDIKDAKEMTPIAIALQEGHMDCVHYLREEAERRILERNVLLERELYMGFAGGNFNHVRELIEKLGYNFKVNKEFNAGETLLLKASEKGTCEIVEFLIEKGATGVVNQYTGISPLYAACVAGHVDIARVLLKQFPDSARHRTKVENNMPLHIVSGTGNLEITKLLLQNHDDGSELGPCIGFDINCQTSSGMTPLHAAATAGHVEIVELLLKPNHRCIPPCKMNLAVDVNAQSKVGHTSLHDAVLLGHVDVTRILLENNANPNCVARTDERDLFDGELPDEIADMVSLSKGLITPLELACYNKNAELIKVLLKYSAKDLGNKCLKHVIATNDEQLVDLLLGKDVHVSQEYKLPHEVREQRTELAPVSIVWHNYSLNNLDMRWIQRAPKAVLRADLVTSMDKQKLVATITNLDISKNSLGGLPVAIFQLPSLKHLNASHNDISFLPWLGHGSPDAGNASSDDVFDENVPRSSSVSMWYCPHLEEVELQNNNLTSLPACLFMLPALRNLNACENDIGSVPFDLWNTPNLRTVLLSNNYIKSLPVLPNASEVFSSNLNCGKGKKSTEPTKTERRNSPSTGRDRTDESKEEKPAVERMRVTSFRALWGHGNQESEDSDEDEDVDRQTECPLEKLDLSFNQLETFPVGLPCLAPKLSKLLLSNNNIHGFPAIPDIPEHLSHLDLSSNKLQTCIPNCEDRTTDRLCYSPIQKRRKYSKRHRRSQTSVSHLIICRHCRHRILKHMKRLELNNNNLKEVRFLNSPPRLLKKTNSLSSVHKVEESAGGGSSPAARSPPASTCVFPNLISLTLNDNRLEYLTKELGQLTKLGSLDVSNNPLTKQPRLPPEIGMLGDLWDLNLKGLNLIDPPSNVLEKRTKAITGYLLSVLDNAKPYPNMKLMFVGISNIGKTTLLAKLREDGVASTSWHERLDNKKTSGRGKKSGKNVSTVGVDVSEWLYPTQANYVFRTSRPSLKFSTWDFGGQNEYYATHQCFLSQRALYLAIWKLTDGEQGVRNLEPWLLNIQARAPDSTVVIVGTFYDQLTNKQRKSGYVEAMHALIYQQYVGKDFDGGGVGCPRERGLPKVVHAIDVSCVTGHNIQKLRDTIYNTAMDIKCSGRHGLVEEQLIPASYLAVEAAVKNVAAQCYAANHNPVLKAEQFRSKVGAELDKAHVKLRDLEELEQACLFLHDNGVLLHYDDPSLHGLYFLDPQWLCDMLAHVVAIRDVNPFVQNGVMRLSDLSQLFRSDRFPTSLIREYINLLNKFDVALLWNKEHLLVPSLLPEKQIIAPNILAPGVSKLVARSMNMAAYTENRVLRRQYVMSYVPSGFWARLIARMINDKQLKAVMAECMAFVMDGHVVAVDEKERSKLAKPEWSCWKSGLELSCNGVKLLRVCQLKNTPFYGCPEGESQSFSFLVNGQELQTSSSAVEVIAPSVLMIMEKFFVQKDGKRGDAVGENGSHSSVQNFVGFRVKNVCDSNLHTAARFLALTIDHIDTLLSDWYPGLDTTNIFGENLVTRLTLCNKCIRRVIALHAGPSHSPRPSIKRHKKVGEREPGCESHECAHDGNTAPSYGSFGNSTFYGHEDDDVATDETSESPSPQLDSRSSDSDSSSGHGTDGSYGNGAEHGEAASQHEESAGSRGTGFEDIFRHTNGFEHDDTDGETDRSSASSQTSGIGPSPRHRGRVGDRLITAFEFEECVVSSHKSDSVLCPVDGELPLKEIAPDVVFADIAPELNIEACNISRKKFLGRGSFGTVYAGEMKQDGKIIQVAMKMPLDNEVGDDPSESEIAASKAAQRKADEVPLQIFTDAYRTVRQELTILIYLNHPHILKLKGFCLNPLSLILEFAPRKSLERILADYKRAGPRLDPYVLQKCVVQCSAALKYLHKHNIIYRDLKSENILVWEFPNPFSPKQPGQQVLIKVADYGISRLAGIAGGKGLGGTPGFMAPEIEKYSGRESYTVQVDSFSFGMFIYELVTLSQPFSDLTPGQVKQLIVEGKRPPLTAKDKRAPVFALELMTWCWSPNPDERPSSDQIYSISLSSEFPRLLDVLTFDELLHLPTSITTGSRDYTGLGADGQLNVGKEVWLFHSKERPRKEIVNTLCYINGRYDHLEEFDVGKDVIRVACSVGNTVWLATNTGFINVYCALTYKQLCQGTLPGDKYISSMIHVPKCNCVLVALSNGQVMAYSDNVTSHSSFKESCDLTSPKDLTPLRIYPGTRSIHCMAAVAIPKEASIDDNAKADGAPHLCFEVWCGEQKGRIAVLSADTLQEKAFLAAEDCELDNPCLQRLTVTSLETCQTYSGSISPQDPLASSVWVAVYPGTSVYRFDARVKRVVNSVDCSQNRPSYEGSHQIYDAGNRHITKSQVLSLLVVNHELFIGTTNGCFLVCNSLSLLVYSVIRCHESSLECVLPLTTTPVTWNVGTEESSREEHSRLVLTCGKGYRSICPGRAGDGTRTKSVVLVWLADQRET